MNANLKPWARGPFEVIVDAEMHRLNGEDYDRRLALIGFDNAIEISITIYINLHPLQRNGVQYNRQNTENWLSNFHRKLEFFYDTFLPSQGKHPRVPRENLIWYHRNRNGLYHGDVIGVPDIETLQGAREAAFWIFCELFETDHSTLEQLVDSEIKTRTGKHWQKAEIIDRLIDERFGVVEVGEAKYYTSEILFAVDPDYYTQLGQDLKSSEMGREDD